GSNNHLLFITYSPKHIDVFDLNKFKFVAHSTLPTDNYIRYHCFISKAGNDLTTGTRINENKKKNEMVLVCWKTGLTIEYYEDSNFFVISKLRVCSTIRLFYAYAHVCVNDVILFFGGFGGADVAVLNAVHIYSMIEKQWIKFEYTLPTPLYGCVGLLSEDKKYFHILGGRSDENKVVSRHIKTKVDDWMQERTEKEKQWLAEENEKIEIEQIKGVAQALQINELNKVGLIFFVFD
ncbi:hypothetical protein RFI_01209, partial [Reticulomyxa filosa]